ncbi:MAG: U32 family peptidase [bacterium]
MKLCVPTSWDNRLIVKLDELNKETKNIHELYGTMRTSVLGGGRPAARLPQITFSQAKEHIELAHSCGFSFNYLLNAPCHGGREFEVKFRQKMHEYLEQVRELNADTITVSNPYLLELIKKEYPSFKIIVGSFAEVDSLNTAVYYDRMGVECIILACDTNRKFEELKKIRRNVGCGLEVMINDGSLFDCPRRRYCSRLAGHVTQEGENGELPLYVSYTLLKCSLKRLAPDELMKSIWIRPEDIGVYEDIGIEYFKIAGRSFSTEWILRCAGAYSKRSYNGNLLELMELHNVPILAPYTGDRTTVSSLFHIDNRALDGFIDFFKEYGCDGDCRACRYCTDFAKTAVKTVGDVEAFKSGLEDVLSKVVSKGFTEADIYRKLCALHRGTNK